jgi:hypothetical protein
MVVSEIASERLSAYNLQKEFRDGVGNFFPTPAKMFCIGSGMHSWNRSIVFLKMPGKLNFFSYRYAVEVKKKYS